MSKKSRVQQKEVSRQSIHRAIGWTMLLVWLLFGMLLEMLHGFKLSAYLLDEIRREFWSLAHFHGVAFGILHLIYVRWADADELSAAQRKTASRLLIWGSLLMPLGFFLGGAWHFEGDPGVGIFLAPIGGVMILVLAGVQAYASWGNVN